MWQVGRGSTGNQAMKFLSSNRHIGSLSGFAVFCMCVFVFVKINSGKTKRIDIDSSRKIRTR